MIPPGARVWIAMGHTDMRKGMQGLALMVQQSLKRDPHGGDLFVFRGRAGSLVKISAFERKRPAKKPFPEHLPRERVVISAPCSCSKVRLPASSCPAATARP